MLPLGPTDFGPWRSSHPPGQKDQANMDQNMMGKTLSPPIHARRDAGFLLTAVQSSVVTTQKVQRFSDV